MPGTVPATVGTMQTVDICIVSSNYSVLLILGGGGVSIFTSTEMCHQQPYFSGHLSFQLKFIFDNSSPDLVCGSHIILITFFKKKYFTCDLISVEYYQNDQQNNLFANRKRNVCVALFSTITLFAKDT